jgi:hypothetical protein
MGWCRWDGVDGMVSTSPSLCRVVSLLQLDDGSGRVLGGCSMEYNVEAGPAKYLVGTEQGIVLSINLRKRKGPDCVVPMDTGRCVERMLASNIATVLHVCAFVFASCHVMAAASTTAPSTPSSATRASASSS